MREIYRALSEGDRNMTVHHQCWLRPLLAHLMIYGAAWTLTMVQVFSLWEKLPNIAHKTICTGICIVWKENLHGQCTKRCSLTLSLSPSLSQVHGWTYQVWTFPHTDGRNDPSISLFPSTRTPIYCFSFSSFCFPHLQNFPLSLT